MRNFYIFTFFLILSLVIIFVLPKKFFLGMDVAGGTILTYELDLKNIPEKDIKNVLDQTKDLIERRINFLGVSEFFTSFSQSGRILVEIPYIKNPEEAIKIIGETPFLEFRVPIELATTSTSSKNTTLFIPSGLTGKYLKRAEISYNPQTLEPYVLLYFNQEGAKIFKELTQKYLQKPIAIYLDNQLISAPIVRDVIENGQAQIIGNFTLDEAKKLANRLNQGALPAPLSLISVSIVNPLLGEKFLKLAIKGSIIGVFLVILFMIIIYRFKGLLASLALIFFIIYNLAFYKILGVTISLAALVGFLLAIGMAVDANILIFERMREEEKINKERKVEQGFNRAFPAIRDSNITTIISSLIIYFLTVSFVKGFALTLFLGVVISFLTAVFLTRSLLEIFKNV